MKFIKKSFNLKIVLLVVVGTNFLFLISQFLLITAFPTIIEEFNINTAQVQWLNTSFLIASTIVIPLNGFLVERFLIRWLVLIPLILLISSSILSMVSPSFWLLLLARVVQGLASGVILPLAQTVLLNIFPKKKRGQAMGLLGLVMNVAPALGPATAGIIIDLFGWRYLFLVIVFPAILLFIFAFFFLKNITIEKNDNKFELKSFLLITSGILCIMFGLSLISVPGWSIFQSIILFSIGIGAIVFFIKYQLFFSHPMLNIRIFKNPIYTTSTISVFLVSTLLLSAETLLPIFAQDLQERTAFVSGIILMPGTIVLAIFSYIGGRLFDRFGDRFILSIGFFFLITSLIFFSLFSIESSLYFMVLSFIIFMAGISLTMMPQVTIAMNQLSSVEVPHGTAIMSTLRQLGMAIGITLLSTIVISTNNNEEQSSLLSLYQGINYAFLIMLMVGILALTFYLMTLYFRKIVNINN